ncbi:MAG: hypothetical protein IPL46_05545 [Saprospiraceae bacterium]|nr:hypothetical protein [Saprospiraceae bacterium]
MKYKNSNRSLVLLILLLLIAAIAFFMLPSGNSSESGNITGKWEFYFTYSNDTNLIYRGDLEIEMKDSLQVSFAIVAPKSLRPEMIKATKLTMVADKISGSLIYDRYKIRGGFLIEYFELQFNQNQTFSGFGRCTAFCAEGTDQSTIRWYGSKQITTPNN